ncbi:hypothetical protein LV82_00426 [Albidovulum inexpectatum]|uniref:Uncharacterized protein n=1 Tax=Albidovulum inexpectatum TaxID=196587 RepID=A0A2S5JM39_9RHOB|nr:hypothetical protein [Albidovulum inexpectatum]PPB82492.1 hypothetical protein LV82_00426 [Albidovulum inexpectatum]
MFSFLRSGRVLRPAVAFAGALIAPSMAAAYIGPGVGAGAIAAVLGVIGSVLLAVVAVLYYPIKRMLKGRKGSARAEAKKPAE